MTNQIRYVDRTIFVYFSLVFYALECPKTLNSIPGLFCFIIQRPYTFSQGKHFKYRILLVLYAIELPDFPKIRADFAFSSSHFSLF